MLSGLSHPPNPASCAVESSNDFWDAKENPFIDSETYSDVSYRFYSHTDSIFKSPTRLDPILSQPIFALKASQSTSSSMSKNAADSPSVYVPTPEPKLANTSPVAAYVLTSSVQDVTMLLFDISAAFPLHSPGSRSMEESFATYCSQDLLDKSVQTADAKCTSPHITPLSEPLERRIVFCSPVRSCSTSHSRRKYSGPSIRHVGSLASPFELNAQGCHSAHQDTCPSPIKSISVDRPVYHYDGSDYGSPHAMNSPLSKGIQNLSPLTDISSYSPKSNWDAEKKEDPTRSDWLPRRVTRAQLKTLGISTVLSTSSSAAVVPYPASKKRKKTLRVDKDLGAASSPVTPAKRPRTLGKSSMMKHEPTLPINPVKFPSAKGLKARQIWGSTIEMRQFPDNLPINTDFPLIYKRFPISSYYFDTNEELIMLDSSRPKFQESVNLPRSAFDLYTPRFTKGVGSTKMGLCPICVESRERGGAGRLKWWNMKNSAYKYYHMQIGHGISSATGLPFSPPVAFRVAPRAPNKILGSQKSHLLEAKCHDCKKWIPVEGAKLIEVKIKELYWWKHASTCHKTSRIQEDRKPYIEDAVYKKIIEITPSSTGEANEEKAESEDE